MELLVRCMQSFGSPSFPGPPVLKSHILCVLFTVCGLSFALATLSGEVAEILRRGGRFFPCMWQVQPGICTRFVFFFRQLYSISVKLSCFISFSVLLHNIFLANSFAIIFLPIPSVPKNKYECRILPSFMLFFKYSFASRFPIIFLKSTYKFPLLFYFSPYIKWPKSKYYYTFNFVYWNTSEISTICTMWSIVSHCKYVTLWYYKIIEEFFICYYIIC